MKMSVSERERGAGIAAVGVALAAFSWGFVIAKVIHLPAPVLAFWRLIVGAGVLGILAVVWRVPWPTRWRDVLIAGLAFGAHQLLYLSAVQRTSIAIVVLIGAIQPLTVAMVSHKLVGEKVPRRFFAWVLLAVVGVAIVMGANLRDPSHSVSGDLFAVVNVFMLTGYLLYSKRARMDGAPTLTLTAAILSIALLVVAPVTLLSGVAWPNRPQWGFLLLLALGSGNGHLLVNWAHTRVSAALVALTMSALPILAALWARLVLGEPFGVSHVLGLAVVLVAIEMGRRVDHERAPTPTAH